MRLLIIRHADPDYSIDSLTEKGWREAEALSEKLAKEKIDYSYVSPLGRARDTAEKGLEKLHMEPVVCNWLREFHAPILRPDRGGDRIICWDWLPQDWTVEDMYYDHKHWADTEIMKEGNVKEEYERVTVGLDELLARHGYVREGRIYKAEKANNDTIAIFCHFGAECVLLAHLLGVSPMVLWHGFCAAPSSVTTVYTEERREGIASFRVASFGDISHLYVAEEPPAFAARFCECYSNEEERHD